MTHHYELLGSIRSALHDIADHYDMALIPPTRQATKLPTTPSPDAKIKYAPKGMKEAPAPVSLHALDARLDASRDLRYWVGFIYDEIRDHNGDHIRTLVDGDNIPAMTRHINTWADLIVTQHPDDATNLHHDMTAHANKLRNLAYPDRRDWLPIGDCPITIADPEGNSVVCGAKVRAYPKKQFIKCPSCGTEDTMSWWMSQIVPEGSDKATATEVIAFAAARAGLILHHDQIRKWKSLGHICGHGKDAKGRTLYSSVAVLAYAQDKRKEEPAAS